MNGVLRCRVPSAVASLLLCAPPALAVLGWVAPAGRAVGHLQQPPYLSPTQTPPPAALRARPKLPRDSGSSFLPFYF